MTFPHAWAKLEGERFLPLLDHGTDVATVFEVLLREGWSKRLEFAAGRTIDEHERQVLLALAFLHDIGKCNRGFWMRQVEGSPLIGHTSIVLALSFLEVEWDRLGMLERLVERCGMELFNATLAHHGRPAVEPKRGLDVEGFWKRRDSYDPIEEMLVLLSKARDRYPLAFDETLGSVSFPPRAISMYAGLLTLADWLGSDSERFEIPGEHGEARVALARSSALERLERLGLVEGHGLRTANELGPFSTYFDADVPYESQARAADLDYGRVVVLEAETGSGKTEAALWRFLTLFSRGEVDSLYFALPTRTSAVQLHGRVQRFLDRAFGEDRVEAVLAVPGYLRAGATDGASIGRFETHWPDDPRDGVEDARWAAESPKRYLAARVAVGTVDQVLMAGLKVRHAHLRAACLSRSLLVIDEVHASDTYMTEVLTGVLRNHVRAGGHAMLLSATLGSVARTRLLAIPESDCPTPAAAATVPYPALHGAGGARAVTAGERTKDIAVELFAPIDDPAALATLALQAARCGALVLVIRNTVADAIATLRALEGGDGESAQHLFDVDGVATLHHGRFAPADRRRLDARIEEVFGKKRIAGRRGVVAVGTQTLEMSLDLDADLLICDLAPIDVLLQRFGRLHRHERDERPDGFGDPRVIVATPAERDLSPFLGRVQDRHGLGPVDGAAGGVYPNLASIEATWRALERAPCIRVPYDNRDLVERATHPELLETIEHELGWRALAAKRDGALLFERHVASSNSLDLAKRFDEDFAFPGDEEKIRTRLGTPGWRLELQAPALGPFGFLIDSLVIPAWMLDGMPEVETLAVSDDDGGFVFSIGARNFRYDRFGLTRVG